jgi:hypothetical protein
MTDDDAVEVKEMSEIGEIPEIIEEHHEPDFAPVASSPIFDDAAEDEDPHASFDVAVKEENTFIDPYGVGAPKGHSDDFGGGDDDDDEEEGYLMSDTDSY